MKTPKQGGVGMIEDKLKSYDSGQIIDLEDKLKVAVDALENAKKETREHTVVWNIITSALEKIKTKK